MTITNESTPDAAADTAQPTADPKAACEIRATYVAAAQALSEALARKTALNDRSATMARAGDAAQAEADALRQQWRELLRASDGVLTREIQKLRASERGALTLVEEYAAMQQEIQGQIAGMEVAVAELAAEGIKLRNGVLDAAACEAFDAMIDKAGDALATAYVLHRRATLEPLLVRMRPSDEQVLAGFLHRLGQKVQGRTGAVAGAVAEAVGVPELELAGVDMALAGSPTQRSQLRQELASLKIA